MRGNRSLLAKERFPRTPSEKAGWVGEGGKKRLVSPLAESAEACGAVPPRKRFISFMGSPFASRRRLLGTSPQRGRFSYFPPKNGCYFLVFFVFACYFSQAML